MPYDSILDTIGNTPLVEVPSLSPKKDVRLYVKLEGQNPTGSLKDRMARYMVERAERRGELTPGRILLEPTSGNTGISLAMICQRKGYKLVAVMRENIELERQQLLQAFDAGMVLTDAAKGTNGAIDVAKQMAAEDPRYFMLMQYENPANPLAHYDTTGPEILAEVPDVDVFVAGMGTGGTIMGVGRRLKERNPSVKVVGVEPHAGDPVAGLRSLDQGYVPPIVDTGMLDGRALVHSRDANLVTQRLLQEEGIFAGPSSGAVVFAARRIAERMDRGKIVCLLADGGWKYLSTRLYETPVEASEGPLEGHFSW